MLNTTEFNFKFYVGHQVKSSPSHVLLCFHSSTTSLVTLQLWPIMTQIIKPILSLSDTGVLYNSYRSSYTNVQLTHGSLFDTIDN